MLLTKKSIDEILTLEPNQIMKSFSSIFRDRKNSTGINLKKASHKQDIYFLMNELCSSRLHIEYFREQLESVEYTLLKKLSNFVSRLSGFWINIFS